MKAAFVTETASIIDCLQETGEGEMVKNIRNIVLDDTDFPREGQQVRLMGNRLQEYDIVIMLKNLRINKWITKVISEKIGRKCSFLWNSEVVS